MNKHLHLKPSFITILLTMQFVIVTSICWSQKSPEKFGRVSPSSLNMISCDIDSTADAMYLFDFGNISFLQDRDGIKAILSRHARVKIFNENAYDHADIEISYMSSDESQQVKDIKAHSISPDGKKTKLNKKDIFIEEVNDNISKVKFAIPNIQPGSIIEYEYSIYSDRLATLFEWHFQKSIPSKHSELYTAIPGYLEYLFLIQGESSLAVYDRWESGYDYFAGADLPRQCTKMVMKDVLPIKAEAHVTTIENHRTKIRFQLAAALDNQYGYRKEILGTWENLHQILYEHDGFGKILSKKRKTKNFIEEGLSHIDNSMSEFDKAVSLYDYMVKNYTWNEKYGIISENSLDDLLDKKNGNSGQLNIALIRLMKEAEIEAHPVLTGSRDNGIILSTYPLLDQFNHVVGYCKIDDKEIYFDAINPYLPFGLISSQNLNNIGWLISEDKHKWVSIKHESSADMFQLNGTITNDGLLEVNLKSRYTNYNAVPERRYTVEKGGTNAVWNNKIGDNFINFELIEFDVKNLSDTKQPFMEDIDLKIEEFAEKTGDIIKLNPILYSAFSENPFKSERRYYPVEFNYPMDEMYSAQLTIPDNWEIVSLPDPISAVFSDKIKYQYNVQSIGNKIIAMHSLKISEVYYSADDYQYIKEIFDYVANASRNQIVFKEN